MAGRNRNRRPGRRPPFRNPKPTILIVTEGEATEPEYLRGLQRACRNPRVTVRVAPEHGVPKTVVSVAKRYKDEAEAAARRERDENLAYDSVWGVFDVDDHPAIGEAKAMARDSGIDLAISNPCIELWLLLHFRDNPGMQGRETVRKKLKEHVPDYEKHVDYATYADGYAPAVRRARKLDDEAERAGEPHRNPSTGLHRLTELIRGDDDERRTE
jgi:hypothetical protein